LNEVERIEWYYDYGVTSQSQLSSIEEYNDYISEFDTLSFYQFSQTVLNSTYTPQEPVETDVWTKIKDFFDTSLGTALQIIIGIILIAIVVVVEALLHANLTIMLPSIIGLSLVFIVLQIFPIWLAIVITGLLFAILVFLSKADF